VLISPWAKANAVDHTLNDQSSVTRFIEDNWSLGRIDGSFDAIAGPLTGMLNLTNPQARHPTRAHCCSIPPPAPQPLRPRSK
jgi:phospholipase C